MLRELRLNNLAIIKTMDLNFNNGLISLTGETGAGKSIILDGISLLIGERSSVDMIRTGEENLSAEGIFDITDEQKNKLIELGYDIDDNELIINRVVDKNSKTKITINGKRMNVSTLKQIMSNVLDLVGQHEHQYLLNKNFHLALLDKFLDKDGKNLYKKIQENVREIKKLNKKISEIESEKMNIMEKKSIYEFQFNEINSLKLKENEDNELEEEYKILFNAGKIGEKLVESIQKLKEGEFSVSVSLAKVQKNLEYLSTISENYTEMANKIENISYEIEEISYFLENMADDIEVDDFKLEKVMNRLNEINKLKSKYGATISEILMTKNDLENKLSLVKFENEELDKLKKEKKEKTEIYLKDCERLREMRKKIAEYLSEKIDNQLKDLNMVNAKFKVQFTEKKVISFHGMDEIEFMMTTNVGESFKSLSKIASGGEVSRIMLALKIVFSEVDNITVLIFDEIDTGISGETVRKVAEKLKELSSKVQVICVTHSPQIAGKSQQQFFIKKEVEDGYTETKVRELNIEERTKEIARIISGDNITEASIIHAKEIMGLS